MQIVTQINTVILTALGMDVVISHIHTHGAAMFIVVHHAQVEKQARDVMVPNAVREVVYVNHPHHLLVMQVNA